MIGFGSLMFNPVVIIAVLISVSMNLSCIIGGLLLSGGNKKGIGFIIAYLLVNSISTSLGGSRFIGIIIVLFKAFIWNNTINSIRRSEVTISKDQEENLEGYDEYKRKSFEERIENKPKKNYLETIVKKGESLESESLYEKVKRVDSNKMIRNLVIVGIIFSFILAIALFNSFLDRGYIGISNKQFIVIGVMSVIHFIGIAMFVEKNKIGCYLIILGIVVSIYVSERSEKLVFLYVIALLIWGLSIAKAYKYMVWINSKEEITEGNSNKLLEKIIKILLCITLIIVIGLLLYYVVLYGRRRGIQFSKEYFLVYGLGIIMYITAALIFIKGKFRKLATLLGSSVLSVIILAGIYNRRAFRYAVSFVGIDTLTVHCKILKVFYLLLALWGLIVLLDLIRTVLKTSFVEDVKKYI